MKINYYLENINILNENLNIYIYIYIYIYMYTNHIILS